MTGRELIHTGTDKRYVRRDERGRFRESDDVGRSLAADRRQRAAMETEAGQGDRGDRGGRRESGRGDEGGGGRREAGGDRGDRREAGGDRGGRPR